MKILILADSHGNYPLAVRAVDQTGRVDLIIHLGDGVDDAQLIQTISEQPVVMVSGNCDVDALCPGELRRTFALKGFFITHGDRYGVKSGLSSLYKKAIEENVAVVLYGHTHVPAIETVNGVLFVNPGCLRKNSSFTSYAILNIIAGEVSAEIVEIR